MRCRSCQSRVPSGLEVCPKCGAALRPSWQAPLLEVVVLLSVAGLAYVLTHYVPWDRVRSTSEQVRLPPLAFLSTPTPEPSRTPTRRPSATPTHIRTMTPVPPTVTPSPTVPIPTLTRIPPSRTPLPKASPTSIVLSHAAPLLLSPNNQQQIKGGSNQIRLTWQPAVGLGADEWYALSIRYLSDGVAHYDGTWTRDTTWLVPRDLFNRAGQLEREFQWDVTIMRQTGTKADGGREGIPVSPTSATWTFLWT
jgi:hypothetical protein